MSCWEGLAVPADISKGRGRFLVFPQDGIGTKAGDIVERLKEYADRQLSFESDALNAMLGIFRRYQVMGVYQIWGIPFLADNKRERIDQNFTVALGWEPLSSKMRRREGFPSWSWVGWENRRHLDVPWGSGTEWYGSNQENPHRGIGVHVMVTQLAAGRLPDVKMPLSDYVQCVQSGADFTQFSKSITVSSASSKCRVSSRYQPYRESKVMFSGTNEIDIEFPADLDRYSLNIVSRIMGAAGTHCGTLSGQWLDAFYLGTHVYPRSLSRVMLSFLIVRNVEGSDEYTRVGCLRLTLRGPVKIKDTFLQVESQESFNADDHLPSIYKSITDSWTVKSFKLV